jgi:tetratricopeptide (TPR) repeat protein
VWFPKSQTMDVLRGLKCNQCSSYPRNNKSLDRSNGRPMLESEEQFVSDFIRKLDSEFDDYLKYFSQTENAPSAQFYIGMMYDRAKQYEDAVQAFDAVLEKYPDNPKTPEAIYHKGEDLMNGGHRTDAAPEFKDFIARFPEHNLAAKAQGHLRELGLSVAPAARRTTKNR